MFIINILQIIWGYLLQDSPKCLDILLISYLCTNIDKICNEGKGYHQIATQSDIHLCFINVNIPELFEYGMGMVVWVIVVSFI